MQTKPILMSGPLVRALLDGTKTQTRRVMKPQPDDLEGEPVYHDAAEGPHWYPPTKIGRDGTEYPGDEVFGISHVDGEWGVSCPYQPGMYLWVRETWQIFERFADCATIRYRASEGRSNTELEERRSVSLARDYDTSKWRPSIHMPRWASRLTLYVTDVRAERLQGIGDTDIRSEGFGLDGDAVAWGADLRGEFADLWNSLHSEQHQWNANPWVWVVTFTVHHCNVDTLVREAA